MGENEPVVERPSSPEGAPLTPWMDVRRRLAESAIRTFSRPFGRTLGHTSCRSLRSG